MKMFRLFGYGSILGGVSIGVAACVFGLSERPAHSASENRPEDFGFEQGTFCLGYVDVESGVVELRPLQAGRVAEISIEENAPVAKDDVLLRLDHEAWKLKVQEAKAALLATEARYDQARLVPSQHEARKAAQKAMIQAVEEELRAARQNLERKRRVENRQIISQAVLDAAEIQVRQLEAKRTAEAEHLSELESIDPAFEARLAEEQRGIAQAKLSQAENALEECVLRAPSDGKVLRKLVGLGDVLGGMAGRPAFVFCPDEPRIVRAEVEQEFAANLKPGQSAHLQSEARPEEVWTGEVVRISDWCAARREIRPESLPYQDARTVECIIRIHEGQPPLRIGQRMQVVIKSSSQ